MILPPPLRVIPILTTGPGPPRFARDLQGGMTAVDGPTVLSPIYAAARGGPFPGPSASVAPPSIHHVAEPLPGPHTLRALPPGAWVPPGGASRSPGGASTGGCGRGGVPPRRRRGSLTRASPPPRPEGGSPPGPPPPGPR